MSDKETTKKYKVIAELGVRIDRPHRKDDVIDLTEDQARYLLLNNKIELDGQSSTKQLATEASHKQKT